MTLYSKIDGEVEKILRAEAKALNIDPSELVMRLLKTHSAPPRAHIHELSKSGLYCERCGVSMR